MWGRGGRGVMARAYGYGARRSHATHDEIRARGRDATVQERESERPLSRLLCTAASILTLCVR